MLSINTVPMLAFANSGDQDQLASVNLYQQSCFFIVLQFNDMSTFLGQFVSSPRERDQQSG